MEGDAGAPLEEEEISILEDSIGEIVPFMTQEGIREVAENGVFDIFMDGTYVTPLINDADCVYLVKDSNGIYGCAIEKAYEEDKIAFQKPISCHLYPIRLSTVGDMEVINYHHWDICKEALKLGKEQGLPMFQFLKAPIIRKYGDEFYEKMEAAYAMMKK